MQTDSITDITTTDWEPSANQVAVLKAFADGDYAISVTEACVCAGVDRTAIYRWMKDENFRQWWSDNRQSRAELALTRIDTAMIQAATGNGKGNPAAAKLLYERFDDGYVPTSRTESTSVELHGDIGVMLAAKVAEIAARSKPVLDVEAVPVLPVEPSGPE